MHSIYRVVAATLLILIQLLLGCASFPPGGPYVVENQSKSEIRLEIYPSFGANIFGSLYRSDTYIVHIVPQSRWDSLSSSASERVPYDERLMLGGGDWIVLSSTGETKYVNIRRQRYNGRVSRLNKLCIAADDNIEFYDQDNRPIQGDRVRYLRWLGSHE